MVSDITVLLAQEIFMDLIHTTYRHSEATAHSRKLPTPEEGQQVCSSSFKLHQSNTLHWVSVTERSEQGELQAQGSGSHNR